METVGNIRHWADGALSRKNPEIYIDFTAVQKKVQNDYLNTMERNIMWKICNVLPMM